jgi:hypothetical protein
LLAHAALLFQLGLMRTFAMLELIFTVCSLTQGASCHELLPVKLDDNVTIVGCMMASQIEGAKWAESIPIITSCAPRAGHPIHLQTCER